MLYRVNVNSYADRIKANYGESFFPHDYKKKKDAQGMIDRLSKIGAKGELSVVSSGGFVFSAGIKQAQEKYDFSYAIPRNLNEEE